jgi:hypothetical protein
MSKILEWDSLDLARRTCHNGFHLSPAVPTIRGAGVLPQVLEAFIDDLGVRGDFDLVGCFINATFMVAIKGIPIGTPQAGHRYEGRGRGRQPWRSAFIRTAVTGPLHEVTHVCDTFTGIFTPPRRLIGIER